GRQPAADCRALGGRRIIKATGAETAVRTADQDGLPDAADADPVLCAGRTGRHGVRAEGAAEQLWDAAESGDGGAECAAVHHAVQQADQVRLWLALIAIASRPA